jgi:mannose-6-phosphate isomerase-like protein (cupin superfamily)
MFMARMRRACQVCGADEASIAATNSALRRTVHVCDVCAHIVRDDYPLPRNPLPAQLDVAVCANPHFRQVMYTTDDSRPDGTRVQLVAMTLPPGTAAGWEVHPRNTQYFLLKQGAGTLYTNRGSGDVERAHATTTPLHVGSAWFVEAGEWHDVEAAPDCTLHMLTSYYPPHHPPTRRDRTRKEADERDHLSSSAAIDPAALIAALADSAAATQPPDAGTNIHAAVNGLFDGILLRADVRADFVRAMRTRGIELREPGDPANVPAGVDLPRGPHHVFRASGSVPYAWLVLSAGAPYLQYYAQT